MVLACINKHESILTLDVFTNTKAMHLDEGHTEHTENNKREKLKTGKQSIEQQRCCNKIPSAIKETTPQGQTD